MFVMNLLLAVYCLFKAVGVIVNLIFMEYHSCQNLLSWLFLAKHVAFERYHEARRRVFRRKPRRVWINEGRSSQWSTNLISGTIPDEEFRQNFRMDRLSFFTLVEELDALLQPNSAAFRFDTLTTAKKVAIGPYSPLFFEGHWFP